jgi:hypothetical protein
MRTTLDLNDEIMRQAKRRAADERTSLRALIESALRAHLGRPRKRQDYRLRWRTEGGTRNPGAYIEDRGALFDRMEGRR